MRAVFLVFICGWVVWFLIDKSGRYPPPGSDMLLQDFQLAFDIMRSGRFVQAYLFIWREHYLLLSVLGGVTLSMLASVLLERAGRRRLQRMIHPRAGQQTPVDGSRQGPGRHDGGMQA